MNEKQEHNQDASLLTTCLEWCQWALDQVLENKDHLYNFAMLAATIYTATRLIQIPAVQAAEQPHQQLNTYDEAYCYNNNDCQVRRARVYQEGPNIVKRFEYLPEYGAGNDFVNNPRFEGRPPVYHNPGQPHGQNQHGLFGAAAINRPQPDPLADVNHEQQRMYNAHQNIL